MPAAYSSLLTAFEGSTAANWRSGTTCCGCRSQLCLTYSLSSLSGYERLAVSIRAIHFSCRPSLPHSGTFRQNWSPSSSCCYSNVPEEAQ